MNARTNNGARKGAVSTESGALQDATGLRLTRQRREYQRVKSTSCSANTSVSMNSREIAELSGDVFATTTCKRTIGTLLSKASSPQPQIEDREAQCAANARCSKSVDVFDQAHKRDSIVVVAQLSPATFTRKRIVERWQELESRGKAGRPLNRRLPAPAGADALRHGTAPGSR